MYNKKLLLKLDNLIEGHIIKRPSKLIKSPYVADINKGDCDETILGHCPSLGCCGLVDIGSTILMSLSCPKKIVKDDKKLKCSYTVYLSVYKEKNETIIIGIHPKLGEKLVHSAITNNCLSILKDVIELKTETKVYIENYVDSRFDFSGIDFNNKKFILEVKSVPLADYEDITSKEKKNKNYDDRIYNSKIAYFPDGYRKKTTDTISPRALKHIRELTYLKQTQDIRTIMCYIIQRNDVSSFQPSFIDPIYREAFFEAVNSGVEIITLVVSWNSNGEAYFIRDNLPINFV
jgi:DNA-binding sugar fermentation-stimulating protein